MPQPPSSPESDPTEGAPQAGPGPGPSAAYTWVALIHSPGPTAEGSVLEDPRFPPHLAFLKRMLDEGYLVGAGPLTDQAGNGLAILRLPGEGRLADAVRLANEEDSSVSCGLLDVVVRPWVVTLNSFPENW